tara:strand:- start:10290 stop:11369 length:1080 start_codon:yes stop_codon:yes gene_type:complete
MTDNNFSILLPLKDRSAYTLRFLSYLNWIQFPYKVIIADGGKDERIPEILSRKENFPALEYEYIRYPYDATVASFYKKMADAVSRIESATVAVLDNDDFIISEGIYKCLKILKESSGISSARGAINQISISQDVFGTLQVAENMYTAFPNSISDPTAAGRLKDQTAHFHGNWHNITRSNHVKACWEMINEVSPSNMRFTEQLTGYLNAIWGDGHRSDFYWLLHQQGQRIETEGGSLADHYPAQQIWINSDYWLEDFKKMTEVIGVSISEYDDISVEEGMSLFRKIYPLKLPGLNDLLEKRIKESELLGYDEQRIQNLIKITQHNKVREIQLIDQIQTNEFDAQRELKLLSHFLSSSEHK